MIIYFSLSIFLFCASTFADDDAVIYSVQAYSHPVDKETVSTAAGEALGKAKEAIGEGVQKTKEVIIAGTQKTKEALTKTKDLPKKVVVNIADKALQQIGSSMVEMTEAFECVGPIIDLLEKVSRNPHEQQTLEALKGNRCRGVIKEFAFKCINPKILLAMAVPGIGVAISSACQTIQRLKERLDDVIKEDVAIYEKKGQQPETCPKEHDPSRAGE